MTDAGRHAYLGELRSVIAMVRAAPDDTHESHAVRGAASELVALLEERNELAYRPSEEPAPASLTHGVGGHAR